MITHDKVDAIIVGAGAGGGCVAKQLATSGLKCVMLERGDWPDYEECTNDELINQRTHAIRSLHGPDVAKHGAVGQKSWIPLTSDIAACVGSGTVTYGAMAWRFMPQDFKLKTLYPHIKDSALEDWPITYDDLEPFYEQAEYEIGVSGDMRTNPFAPPRKKPFPMPAFEYNREDSQVVIPAMKRLGLHPFPVPMLRNSVRYNGRAACQRNHTCCGYVCPCDAKNGTQNTVIPVALKTGNCELRTNSLAYEIVMKARRAVGVKYYDAARAAHFQPADIVVVASNARETAKLLFMSKSDLFPTGLGNQNDMVGRCIHSHIYCGAFGIFAEEISFDMGPGATVAISDFNHNPNKGIFAGAIHSDFYTLPWGRSRLRPPDAARWGLEHKKFQRENYRKILHIVGPVQEIPMFESRVVLDESKRNWFGLPILKSKSRRHPLSVKQCEIMVDAATEILKEAGAKTIWQHNRKPDLHYTHTGGQHQAGSCRMGSDPKTSVVDPNCKVWGTDNVFIGDGSVHVSNGGFNPVLTIMACAFRTGAHIAKEFGKA